MEANKIVRYFFLPTGNWDVEKLKVVLPEDMSNWIANTHMGKRDGVEDTIVWNHSKEVDFIVKLAYQLISGQESTIIERHWKQIWNWPGN